jgi:antitoxin MazE
MQHVIHITLRAVGNSKGIVLPKPILAQAGLADAARVELTVENGAIILRRPVVSVRAGWAEAAEHIARQGEDALVMGEFGNEDDAGLIW